MNLLERVLILLRTNLNTVIEKADDPEPVLRQLQVDMRNQLVQVKTQVATAMTQGIHLQKRSNERVQEAEKQLRAAEQAIQQGNDNAARVALSRYNDLNKQSERYLQQKKEQDRLATTLRGALRQLETKISEVETSLDLYLARKRSAAIQQRVFEALNKNASAKGKERLAKAEDVLLDNEARARALADLHQRGIDLDDQLAQFSAEQEVEQQLRALKAQQRLSPEPPLLQEKATQSSSLLEPSPQPDVPARKKVAEQPATYSPSSAGSSSLTKQEIEHLKQLLDASQSPSQQES